MNNYAIKFKQLGYMDCSSVLSERLVTEVVAHLNNMRIGPVAWIGYEIEDDVIDVLWGDEE